MARWIKLFSRGTRTRWEWLHLVNNSHPRAGRSGSSVERLGLPGEARAKPVDRQRGSHRHKNQPVEFQVATLVRTRGGACAFPPPVQLRACGPIQLPPSVVTKMPFSMLPIINFSTDHLLALKGKFHLTLVLRSNLALN